jgi:hypothetical protein
MSEIANFSLNNLADLYSAKGNSGSPSGTHYSKGIDDIDCVGPLLGLARAAAASGRRPEAAVLLQLAR